MEYRHEARVSPAILLCSTGDWSLQPPSDVLVLQSERVPASRGWRNVEKRPTLVFFFSEVCLTPPTLYLPNRVCFSQTYVYFFFFNSEDLRVTSKLITGGWLTFDVD